jgi:hypothetical protein
MKIAPCTMMVNYIPNINKTNFLNSVQTFIFTVSNAENFRITTFALCDGLMSVNGITFAQKEDKTFPASFNCYKLPVVLNLSIKYMYILDAFNLF